jgi:hypothetical protein
MKKTIAALSVLALTLIFYPGCTKNAAPVITSLTADQDTVRAGGVVTITCVATDPEGLALAYHWQADSGSITDPDTNPALWTSPGSAGDFAIVCSVSDPESLSTIDTIDIHVIANSAPVIDSIVYDSLEVASYNQTITCYASDPELDAPLTYYWESPDGGTIVANQDSMNVTWQAPAATQTCRLVCSVSDGIYTTTDTITIQVQNYFALGLGWTKLFEGVLSDSTVTLETNVVSRTDLGNNRIKWDIERRFTLTDTVIVDTALSYTVAGDSVYIHEPKAPQDYLAFLLPFWSGKSWPTGDGGTGAVTEQGSRQVPAGSFSNCMRIQIGGGQVDRDHWFAPDIGIIISEADIRQQTVEFRLVSYDFGP